MTSDIRVDALRVSLEKLIEVCRAQYHQHELCSCCVSCPNSDDVAPCRHCEMCQEISMAVNSARHALALIPS